MGVALDWRQAYLALANSIDEIVFVWNTSGQMLWTNAAFTRETGLRVEDFGFDNRDNPFVHPDDLPSVVAFVAAFDASDAQKSDPIENRFTDAWGRTRTLRTTLHKIKWDGGNALMGVGTLTRRELPTEADASYRRLVEAADDGIVKLAADGRVLFANRCFQQMMGLRAVELAKLALPDVVHADDRPLAEGALARLAAGEPRVLFEARLLLNPAQDGGPRWLAINAGRLDDDAAPLPANGAAFLAIARDVTEARRLEEKIREDQKSESLGVLAGGLVHDFNNIVTGVLANATLGLSLVGSEGTTAGVLDDIRVAGERAAALNRSLLSYIGKAPTDIRRVSLTELVSETVRMIVPLVSRSIDVQVDASAELPLVRADAGQLSQVLLNLLTNAAQAIGTAAGRIHVSFEAHHEPSVVTPGPYTAWLPAVPSPGHYVLLRVTDTGAGMGRDVLRRIFDPFFTTKASGRGLGLSATLGIVRRHGGAIRVASDEGRGTTFELLLPQASATPSSVPPPRAPSPEAPPDGSILVVDDEPIVLRLAERALRRHGYDVVSAEDGNQGLRLFEEEPFRFAVVVTDQNMAGLPGDQMVQRMRRVRPELPVVQSSGDPDVVGAHAAFAHAVVLAKPFTIDQLVSAVETVLGRKGSARAGPPP